MREHPYGGGSLFSHSGGRKYLNAAERQRFIESAQNAPPTVRTFCCMLRWSGGRISEVLAVTPAAIDIDAGVVSIETLKRRKRGIIRQVPLKTLSAENCMTSYTTPIPMDRLILRKNVRFTGLRNTAASFTWTATYSFAWMGAVFRSNIGSALSRGTVSFREQFVHSSTSRSVGAHKSDKSCCCAN